MKSKIYYSTTDMLNSKRWYCGSAPLHFGNAVLCSLHSDMLVVEAIAAIFNNDIEDIQKLSAAGFRLGTSITEM